jgi:hypothetical protein
MNKYNYLKYLLIIFISSFPLFGFSSANNSFIKYNYNVPKKLPKKFIESPIDKYNQLLKSPRPKGWSVNEYKKYCETMCFYKLNLFESGQLYVGWDSVENYVNLILKKIAPTDTNKNIHIYIVNDAEFNAYTIYDGSIFINIGLIANVKTEAALAYIISHEYVHYKKGHVRKGFLESIRTEKISDQENYSKLIISRSEHSKQYEFIADSLGALLALKAGYSIDGAFSNFNIIKHLEHNLPKDGKDEQLSTHPSVELRIDKYSAISNHLDHDSSYYRNFIISEKWFENVKKSSKYELLNWYLTNNQFESCIESAFSYYTFDSQNPDFVYFLLEGIRRKLIVDSSFANKKCFQNLTSDIYEYNNLNEQFKESIEFYTDTVYSIFAKSVISNYKKPFLKFNTYKKAFDYFSSLPISKQNLKILTTIFLNENNASKKQILYNEIVNRFDLKNNDFIVAAFNNETKSALNKNQKKICLNYDVVQLNEKLKGIAPMVLKSYNNSRKIDILMAKYFKNKFPNKILFSEHEFIENHYSDYLKYRSAYRNLSYLSLNSNLSNYDSLINKFKIGKVYNLTSNIDLYNFNPEVWETFKADSINSIEFISGAAFYLRHRFGEFFMYEIAMVFYPPLAVIYQLGKFQRRRA